MLISTPHILSYSLVFASLSLAAPLNERDNHALRKRQGENGWSCQYDGPLDINIDTSIDLATMVASLCAKVNYGHDGCDNFRPPNNKGKSPASDNQSKDGSEPNDDDPIISQSFAQIGIDKDHGDDDKSKDKSNNDDAEKKKKQHKSSPESSNKNDEQDNACSDNEYYSSAIGQCVDKSFFSQPNDDDSCQNGERDAIINLCLDLSLLGDHSITAESFDGPETEEDHGGDHEPKGKSDNDAAKSSPKSSTEDPKQDKSCSDNEYQSSAIGQCVDKSFFSQPNDDDTCQKGERDAIINLCLDLSLLGSHYSKASSADASIDPKKAVSVPSNLDSSEEGSSKKCEQEDQRYSSLVSACVDAKLFTEPLSGQKCENGLELDLGLGLCLDISANVDNILDVKAVLDI